MQRTHTRKGNTVILTQHTYEHNEQQGPTYTLLIGDGHAEYPLTDVNQKLTKLDCPIKMFEGADVVDAIMNIHRELHPNDDCSMNGPIETQYNKAYNKLWAPVIEMTRKQNASRYYLPIDDIDDKWGSPCDICIYKILGTAHEINMIFCQHLMNIGNGPTGADDDTYDYWPSGFGVAHDISRDLDTINKNDEAFKQILIFWTICRDEYNKTRETNDKSDYFENDVCSRPIK